MTIVLTTKFVLIAILAILLIIHLTWRISRYVTFKISYEIIIEQLANSYDIEVVNDEFEKISEELKRDPDHGWEGYLYILIGWNKMFRDSMEEFCEVNGFEYKIMYKPLTNQAYLKVEKRKVQIINGNNGRDDS